MWTISLPLAIGADVLLQEEQQQQHTGGWLLQEGIEPSAFRGGCYRKNRNTQPSVVATAGGTGTISLPWWLTREGLGPSAFRGG